MFSKKQEYELIASIKGRGEIPLKFAYLGDGYKNWDAIANQRMDVSKGINSAESGLLKQKVKSFLSAFSGCKKINIIDIGCGNGYPVVPVLDELVNQGVKVRYVPIDISKELLELAEKNISKREDL